MCVAYVKGRDERGHYHSVRGEREYSELMDKDKGRERNARIGSIDCLRIATSRWAHRTTDCRGAHV